MKRLVFALVVVLAGLGIGCASAMSHVVTATSDAISDAAKLQCGQSGAPAAPLCLSQAAYQKVNGDLNAASQAELAVVQIQGGVASAKGQSLSQATTAMVAALTAALNDLVSAVGDVSSSAANDLSRALGKL